MSAETTIPFVSSSPSNLRLFSNVPSVKAAVSLRSLAYNNYDAICDLIDNSIDAGATKVWIRCNQKSPNDPTNRTITIADNGCGMDEKTLVEAIRLGSETMHQSGDLGFFGMGLLTASWSMTPQVKVLTRDTVKGVILCGVTDLDYMTKSGTWDSFVGQASVKDSKLFHGCLGDGKGTIVVLERIEESQCKTRRVGSFVNDMKNKSGLVFHQRLMLTNLSIMVNGQKVFPIDPMLRDLSGSEIDRTTDVIPVGVDGARKSKFTVRTVLLVDGNRNPLEQNETAIKRMKKSLAGSEDKLVEGLMSATNKYVGVYFVRNMRVINHVRSFLLFGRSPHNSLQRLRVMIEFDESLDGVFGLSFKKTELEMPRSITDLIKSEVVGARINGTVDWYNKNESKTAAETISEDEQQAKAFIEPLARLLNISPSPEKSDNKDDGKDDGKGKDKDDGKGKDKNGDAKSHHHKRERFDIEHIHSGIHAPAWEIGTRGSKVLVRWNVDHPFWYTYIVPNNKEGVANHRSNLMRVVNVIAYGLGAAAMTGRTDLIDTKLNDLELMAAHNDLVESMSRLIRRNCEIQPS